MLWKNRMYLWMLKYQLDKRMFIYLGSFFLVKSAYMGFTDMVFLKTMESEIMEDSLKLE
jgi:hypothetical protein